MTRARRWLCWAWALWAAQGCVCAPDGGDNGDPRPDAGTSTQEGEEANPLDESEPNDAPDRATPFALVPQAPGSPVLRPMEGDLDGDDVDWYAIPAQSPDALRSLRVETAAKDVNLVLLLGSPQDARDVAPAGKPEEWPNLRGDAPFLVGVTRQKHDKRAIAYKLSLSRSPQRPQSLEAEPNPEGGEPLALPQTKQGFLQSLGDADLWVITRDADPEPNRAARLDFKPPPQAHLRLLIRLGDQVLVERELSGDLDPQGKPPTLSWSDLPLPTQDAPLLVEVSLLGEAPGAKDAYTLSANLAPAPPKGELVAIEPNDDEHPLRGLPLDEARLVGWLPIGDKDAFELTVPEASEGPPRVVRAVLTGLEGHAPWLSLQPSEGPSERFKRAPDAASLVVCDRVLTPGVWRWTLGTSSGALDALLPGDKPRDTGEPPAPPQDRYALHLTSRLARDEELEPNDAQARASALAPDQPSRGHLFPQGDADFWAFSLEGPALPPPGAPTPDGQPAPDAAQGLRPVKVEVQDPARDVALELLDEDGVSVARADAQREGGGEALALDLPPGRYLVKLTSKGEATCGEPYRLSVQGR